MRILTLVELESTGIMLRYSDNDGNDGHAYRGNENTMRGAAKISSNPPPPATLMINNKLTLKVPADSLSL